jgi:hypothetical protein
MVLWCNDRRDGTSIRLLTRDGNSWSELPARKKARQWPAPADVEGSGSRLPKPASLTGQRGPVRRRSVVKREAPGGLVSAPPPVRNHGARPRQGAALSRPSPLTEDERAQRTQVVRFWDGSN